MSNLPVHLGGHENETHIDDGALSFLIQNYDIQSMIDIGCGPGGMVELANKKGIDVIGVDGDFTLVYNESIKPLINLHDFTTGAFIPSKKYDLAWSVEFVEHIEQKFIDNFIDTMKHCRYVLMTHAFPNQPGHHHVNCQHSSYWIRELSARGFTYDPYTTQSVRNSSTMRERYIRQQSIFFVNGSV